MIFCRPSVNANQDVSKSGEFVELCNWPKIDFNRRMFCYFHAVLFWIDGTSRCVIWIVILLSHAVIIKSDFRQQQKINNENHETSIWEYDLPDPDHASMHHTKCHLIVAYLFVENLSNWVRRNKTRPPLVEHNLCREDRSGRHRWRREEGRSRRRRVAGSSARPVVQSGIWVQSCDRIFLQILEERYVISSGFIDYFDNPSQFDNCLP